MPLHILLGITGSVAAYKTPDLIRHLRTHLDCEVRVILSQYATHFTTALSIESVSGMRPYTALFGEQAHAMDHIQLGKWADVILVAPASAHFLARAALGLCDDLLTNILLAATPKPLLFAPAMNTRMWTHPSIQTHVRTLSAQGARWIGPVTGALACGEIGVGRMAEIDDIVSAVKNIHSKKSATGKRVLITAGATIEPIDPVRFLSNRGSGKMGYALAEVFAQEGAQVCIVSGAVSATLQAHTEIKIIHTERAQDMLSAVQQEIDHCDIFIATASVCDFYIKNYSASKIKKSADNDAVPHIELARTEDILAWVGTHKKNVLKIGFAAETDCVVEYAKDKMVRKKVDMLIANEIEPQSAFPFNAETNAVHVLFSDGKQQYLAERTKRQLAADLCALILHTYKIKNGK